MNKMRKNKTRKAKAQMIILCALSITQISFARHTMKRRPRHRHARLTKNS